jgi:DNA-binding GntR family transcriptional regulator
VKKLFRWARLASVSDFTTATIKEFFSFRVKMARALAARAARRMAARGGHQALQGRLLDRVQV